MIVLQIIILSLLAPALIEVFKYDDTALVDMRIQDIKVLANVRATAPWMPETPPEEEMDDLRFTAKNDATTQGAYSCLYYEVGMEDQIAQSWSFIQVEWALIDFWPHLVVQLLGLDSNFMPSTSVPPFVLIYLGILEVPEIVSFAFFNVLSSTLNINWNIVGLILAEISKDGLILPAFMALVSTGVDTLMMADGFRLAALANIADPPVFTALTAVQIAFMIAGTIQIVSALLVLEAGHLARKALGQDDVWSLYYVICGFVFMLIALFSGIAAPGFIAGLFIGLGNMVTMVALVRAQMTMATIGTAFVGAAAFNPVIGLITIPFLFLLVGWVVFRLIYYIFQSGLLY